MTLNVLFQCNLDPDHTIVACFCMTELPHPEQQALDVPPACSMIYLFFRQMVYSTAKVIFPGHNISQLSVPGLAR